MLQGEVSPLFFLNSIFFGPVIYFRLDAYIKRYTVKSIYVESTVDPPNLFLLDIFNRSYLINLNIYIDLNIFNRS